MPVQDAQKITGDHKYIQTFLNNIFGDVSPCTKFNAEARLDKIDHKLTRNAIKSMKIEVKS